jgi:lysophospholipase L1-like esterase
VGDAERRSRLEVALLSHPGTILVFIYIRESLPGGLHVKTPIRSFVAIFIAMSVPSSFAGQTEWKYAALGDSLATGFLAQSGYVSRYRDHVQTDTAVAVTLYNLGQNGATSARLLTLLRSDAVVQSAVATSDILTWNIGLNDFRNARTSYKSKKCGGKDGQDCLRQMVATFRSNWGAAVIEILNRRSVANTAMRTMDIYNPWVGPDRSANAIADRNETGAARGTDLQVLKYYLDQMNGEIALSADGNNVPSARISEVFNGIDGTIDPATLGYLASDGLHPSEAGHAAIAAVLRGLAYAPLR